MALLALGMALPAGAWAAPCCCCCGCPWRSLGSLLSPSRRVGAAAVACWDALRRAVDELGEVPSVLAYERYAAARDDIPSSATVRNRLGRWSALTARLVAQRELSHQAQTRVRAVHAALASA